MQGRVENERRMDQRILERLQDKPTYMRSYMNSFSRKSYTTKNSYINYVLEFIDYLQDKCGYDIDNIDTFSYVKPSTIKDYLNYLNHLERTVNGRVVTNGDSIQCRKFYAIKDFFTFLLDDDYIDKNPCDRVKPPQVDSHNEIVAMDEREVSIFLNNVLNGVGTEKSKARQQKWRNRDYAIMTLALSLGLRVTSISEINVEDIDFEDNVILVTEKGNKTRRLLFSNKIKMVLLDWLEERNKIMECGDGAFFISNQRKRLCSKAIEKLVHKYSLGIDKHITPHKLRSTCATNIYNATSDIYLTADVLGHRNIQNTKRYARIADDKREKAAMVMDKIMFG